MRATAIEREGRPAETRAQWEARTGKRLTWDDILPDDGDTPCMICFATDVKTSCTDGFEPGVEPGTFWTYCERCDCWTEHPPRYREPPGMIARLGPP